MRDTSETAVSSSKLGQKQKINIAPEPQSDRPLAAAEKDIDLADWSDHTRAVGAAVDLDHTAHPFAVDCKLVPAAGSRSGGILRCRPRPVWAEE